MRGWECGLLAMRRMWEGTHWDQWWLLEQCLGSRKQRGWLWTWPDMLPIHYSIHFPTLTDRTIVQFPKAVYYNMSLWDLKNKLFGKESIFQGFALATLTFGLEDKECATIDVLECILSWLSVTILLESELQPCVTNTAIHCIVVKSKLVLQPILKASLRIVVHSQGQIQLPKTVIKPRLYVHVLFSPIPSHLFYTKVAISNEANIKRYFDQFIQKPNEQS